MLCLTPFLTASILLFAFILGAVVAGFLGGMAWRIARGGKCAYGKAPIPKSNLIGKILLAVLFVLATIRWELTPKLILTLVFICILYLLSLVDIYIQEIPDGCLVAAIAVRLIYYFVVEQFSLDSFLHLIGSGFSVALPLLLLTLLMEKLWKKEAMGGGDIKLIFVTGLYLGWEKNLLMMLVACIVGILVALVQARDEISKENETDVIESKEGEGYYFPFGPSIAIATVWCMFFGDRIMGWYISLL